MDAFTATTLAALVLHEIDAVRCKEWRIFPLTFWMPERVGRQVFLWAHVPLALLIYYYATHTPHGFAVFMAYFAPLHFMAHVLYLWHPKNLFRDARSWLILLASLLSATLYWLICPYFFWP
jgi:hypothetical protein